MRRSCAGEIDSGVGVSLNWLLWRLMWRRMTAELVSSLARVLSRSHMYFVLGDPELHWTLMLSQRSSNIFSDDKRVMP